MKYAQEADELWRTHVPPSGQADTVQGELIRAVRKLHSEAYRNGNLNWDHGFEQMLTFLKTTLKDPHVFDRAALSEIEADLTRISDYEFPADDEPFHRLADRTVEWCRRHPDPITHQHNPNLHR